MQIEGWKYYNHAAIPTTAPHENINSLPIEDGSIWKLNKGAKMVRWHSDWDCKNETQWWFCIKDTPFNLMDLKAKRRYEINKGSKYFDIKKIIPSDFYEELWEITVLAYSSWPAKYRPPISKERFFKQLQEWNCKVFFGAFEIESGNLKGYAVLEDNKTYVEFMILRVDPDSEKYSINAALVNGILEYYNDRFDGTFYINDGSRSIRHETAFQDYLEKYFGFRKAYCKLHIKYKFFLGIFIRLVYPIRKIISPKTGIGSKLTALLTMESIRRSF